MTAQKWSSRARGARLNNACNGARALLRWRWWDLAGVEFRCVRGVGAGTIGPL